MSQLFLSKIVDQILTCIICKPRQQATLAVREVFFVKKRLLKRKSFVKIEAYFLKS